VSPVRRHPDPLNPPKERPGAPALPPGPVLRPGIGTRSVNPIFPPRSRPPAGRLVRLRITSRLLAGNRLGDPADRELPVWLPPGFDDSRRYPTIWYLSGFGAAGATKLGWSLWSPNIAQRLDRLVGDGLMPPTIVAFPDCTTRLGGSQYIDSTVCGPYGRHLIEELIPALDSTLPTVPDREHRAVLGKSSGGFGALVHAMHHPDVWGAAGCHSGDMGFELCFGAAFPRTQGVIERHGSLEAFLGYFIERERHDADDLQAGLHAAMAACFDPQPELPLGFSLPFDLRTGARIAERWQAWLAWDPVLLVPRHAAALQSLRRLVLDCGTRDPWFLHLGARQFCLALRAHGVSHEYEEFDDGHMGIDYRLSSSLPKLAHAIAL
jgi:enterochelin esterase-like enzyme